MDAADTEHVSVK